MNPVNHYQALVVQNPQLQQPAPRLADFAHLPFTERATSYLLLANHAFDPALMQPVQRLLDLLNNLETAAPDEIDKAWEELLLEDVSQLSDENQEVAGDLLTLCLTGLAQHSGGQLDPNVRTAVKTYFAAASYLEQSFAKNMECALLLFSSERIYPQLPNVLRMLQFFFDLMGTERHIPKRMAIIIHLFLTQLSDLSDFERKIKEICEKDPDGFTLYALIFYQKSTTEEEWVFFREGLLKLDLRSRGGVGLNLIALSSLSPHLCKFYQEQYKLWLTIALTQPESGSILIFLKAAKIALSKEAINEEHFLDDLKRVVAAAVADTKTLYDPLVSRALVRYCCSNFCSQYLLKLTPLLGKTIPQIDSKGTYLFLVRFQKLYASKKIGSEFDGVVVSKLTEFLASNESKDLVTTLGVLESYVQVPKLLECDPFRIALADFFARHFDEAPLPQKLHLLGLMHHLHANPPQVEKELVCEWAREVGYESINGIWYLLHVESYRPALILACRENVATVGAHFLAVMSVPGGFSEETIVRILSIYNLLSRSIALAEPKRQNLALVVDSAMSRLLNLITFTKDNLDLLVQVSYFLQKHSDPGSFRLKIDHKSGEEATVAFLQVCSIYSNNAQALIRQCLLGKKFTLKQVIQIDKVLERFKLMGHLRGTTFRHANIFPHLKFSHQARFEYEEVPPKTLP